MTHKQITTKRYTLSFNLLSIINVNLCTKYITYYVKFTKTLSVTADIYWNIYQFLKQYPHKLKVLYHNIHVLSHTDYSHILLHSHTTTITYYYTHILLQSHTTTLTYYYTHILLHSHTQLYILHTYKYTLLQAITWFTVSLFPLIFLSFLHISGD